MDKADEEFYVPRAEMLREFIDTEGIPLEEKRSLWYSTYMLAQNYERQKQIGSATENMYRLADTFGKIGNTCIEAGQINARTQQLAYQTREDQKATDVSIQDAKASIERISKEENRIKRLNDYTARKLEDTEQTIEDVKETLEYPEEEFDEETRSESELASERKSILEKISKNMKNQEN